MLMDILNFQKIRDENVTNFSSFSVNSLASCWAIVLCFLQVKLLRWRRWCSQPALAANSSSLLSLTVAYICFSIALIILWDTLSLRARLLMAHSCMFISGSSLAFFLPPPGSLALLLSSSDSSVLFFRQSLTLISCRTFLFFCSSSDSYYVAMEMDTLLPQAWRSNILSNESGVLSCWFEHGLNVLLTNQIARLEPLVV